MIVSPEYNKNDLLISLVCSCLLDWFIITMFMDGHGQGERLECTEHQHIGCSTSRSIRGRTNQPAVVRHLLPAGSCNLLFCR